MKRLQILGQGLTFEIVGVRLDGVVEGRGQVLGGRDPRRSQVFGHNGRGGAVVRPDIGERPPVAAVGMMIDDDVRPQAGHGFAVARL